MKKRTVISIIVVFLLFVIALVGGSVYAQGVTSSEPESASIGADSAAPKSHIPSSVDIAGLAPSEGNAAVNSAAAPEQRLMQVTISADANGELVQSEPQLAGSGENPLGTRKGLPSLVAPDAINVVFPAHWFGVLAAGFAPSYSSITYDYGGAGCVHATAAGQWRAAVNLPDGATAKFVYYQYYNPNVSALASTGWLTRYHYSGSVNDLVGFNSQPGSSFTGFGYTLSPEITQYNVIDNANYVYGFVWSGSTTQYFCSMQVGYYPPGAIMKLPQISK